MSDRLARLLAARPFLLADGATGTNLFEMGLMTGDAPELWNFDQPGKIAELHRRMIRAGADIVLTNSFGGTRHRLKLHKAEGRVHEINLAAARIARRVADEEGAALGREIVVAGSMGPTGELFQPLGPLTVAEGTEAFAEQAAGLVEGGVDVLWVETMSSKDEVEAAVAGAGRTGLPVVCTMSFDTNGRTMMGVTPAEAAGFVHQLHPHPAGYGANCGVGAAELVMTIVGMAKSAEAGDVLVAKGNCGVPRYVDGKIQYDGTPPLMADYARLARDAGARIIGGCCGTSPEHLAAMRAALDGYQPGAKPSTAEIVARLGQVSAGAAQQQDGTAPAEGRRRARGERRRAAEG
ncbi:MAG: betaine--homocysteine S-methyltransferase [Dongiaceae bacterium]